MPGWTKAAQLVAPAFPTHTFGRTLDWPLVSPLLGARLQYRVVPDVGHMHVPLTIPSNMELGVGFTTHRPQRSSTQPTNNIETPTPNLDTWDTLSDGASYGRRWKGHQLLPGIRGSRSEHCAHPQHPRSPETGCAVNRKVIRGHGFYPNRCRDFFRLCFLDTEFACEPSMFCFSIWSGVVISASAECQRAGV